MIMILYLDTIAYGSVVFSFSPDLLACFIGKQPSSVILLMEGGRNIYGLMDFYDLRRSTLVDMFIQRHTLVTVV